MAFSNDLLIDQETGELDWTYIKRQSLLKAQAGYGDVAPPVSWVRSEIRMLQDRARILRVQWRRKHGLPDDTVYTTMNVPTWGASGDGFGRGA